MKIAVFSPLNPMKSGVSDFTEEVVLKIKDYVDIDLFVDGYEPSNPEINHSFNVYNYKDIDNSDVRSKYDHLLYHVGNSLNHEKIIDYCIRYPGIIELHDYSLHTLMATMILQKRRFITYLLLMKYCHGKEGESVARRVLTTWTDLPWENKPLHFPMNKHVLENAKGIIVHSDYVKQLIKGILPEKPIKKINLHSYEIIDDFEAHQRECKRKLNIDIDKVMLASFGFATTNKRINEIIEALSLLKKESNGFIYYIVGELQIPDFQNKLEELDLVENVRVTGYTPLSEFFEYMGACDICFNLRYPTQGESSASLHRALGMGKLVFVTRVGSFDDYPDDVVVKINADQNEVQSIYNELSKFLKNENDILKQKKNAIKYAKVNCSIENNCLQYVDFFEQLSKGSYIEEDTIDSFIDSIYTLDTNDLSFDEHCKDGLNKLLSGLLTK